MASAAVRPDHGAIATPPSLNAMNTLNAVQAFRAVFAMKPLLPGLGKGLLQRFLLAVLSPWRVAAAVPGPCHRATPAAQEEDSPRACGWFDSSYELHHGLRVQEHLSADGLGAELPLGAWLELQLSGWRAAAPAVELSAFTPPT